MVRRLYFSPGRRLVVSLLHFETHSNPITRILMVSLLASLASPSSARADADYSRTPVLLVHGWFVIEQAGTATWASIVEKLKRDGWPEYYLRTPSFTDVRGCDPEHANEIALWVDSLIADTGFERVDIVAHSEGALNTLYYIKYLCGFRKVRKFVSLAGAFHGTVVACMDITGSCGAQEMCIGSKPNAWKDNPVLNDLLSCDETPGDVLYTTIWSPWDEIIVPPEGGALEGAQEIRIQTPYTGHGGILLSDEAYEYVRDALLSGGANHDGEGWECMPWCFDGSADANTIEQERKTDRIEEVAVSGGEDASSNDFGSDMSTYFPEQVYEKVELSKEPALFSEMDVFDDSIQEGSSDRLEPKTRGDSGGCLSTSNAYRSKALWLGFSLLWLFIYSWRRKPCA